MGWKAISPKHIKWEDTLEAVNLIATNLQVKGLTSGSVLFSDGTNVTEDNSNLFWDDTNNRLGIGTATPSFPLVISKASNPVICVVDTTNNVDTRINSTNTVGKIGTASNHNLNIEASGAVVMTIEPSGNVGIGIQAPITTLNIADSGSDDITQVSIGINPSYHLTLGHSTNGNTQGFIGTTYNNDAARFDIRMKGNAGTDAKVTVLGDGNVGIGTTSPATTLHASGGAITIADTTAPATPTNAGAIFASGGEVWCIGGSGTQTRIGVA